MEEKTIEREVIYQGKIFDVEKHVVSLPNGNTSVRELVYHNGAVAVLVIDESDNIVMVEQYRKAFESMSLEIPAGKLEKGEEPMASAERELEEETGLDFLPDLPKFIQDPLEAERPSRLWPIRARDIFGLIRLNLE